MIVELEHGAAFRAVLRTETWILAARHGSGVAVIFGWEPGTAYSTTDDTQTAIKRSAPKTWAALLCPDRNSGGVKALKGPGWFARKLAQRRRSRVRKPRARVRLRGSAAIRLPLSVSRRPCGLRRKFLILASRGMVPS